MIIVLLQIVFVVAFYYIHTRIMLRLVIIVALISILLSDDGEMKPKLLEIIVTVFEFIIAWFVRIVLLLL
nr:MAG TPA: hypothetical protein [Crassvirales sp.]